MHLFRASSASLRLYEPPARPRSRPSFAGFRDSFALGKSSVERSRNQPRRWLRELTRIERAFSLSYLYVRHGFSRNVLEIYPRTVYAARAESPATEISFELITDFNLCCLIE